jgi:hypothetical protein
MVVNHTDEIKRGREMSGFVVEVKRTTIFTFTLENASTLTEARRVVNRLNRDEIDGGSDIRDLAFDGNVETDKFWGHIRSQ